MLKYHGILEVETVDRDHGFVRQIFYLLPQLFIYSHSFDIRNHYHQTEI